MRQLCKGVCTCVCVCESMCKEEKKVHVCEHAAAAAAALMLPEDRVTLSARTPLGGASERGRRAQASGLMGVSASVLAVMNGEHLRCSRKAARLKDGEGKGGERASASSGIGSERAHLLQKRGAIKSSASQ